MILKGRNKEHSLKNSDLESIWGESEGDRRVSKHRLSGVVLNNWSIRDKGHSMGHSAHSRRNYTE